MRINSLLIKNFRAIKYLDLKQLKDTVVIAGSNGCGKTQIYNAIRLLKSAYGGYQPNEYQQWFGEFQINLNKPNEGVYRLFRDRNISIVIRAEFELKAEEISFLRESAEVATRARIYQELMPELRYSEVMSGVASASARRTHGSEVESRVKQELSELETLLGNNTFIAELIINPDLSSNTYNNVALELLFSIYQPGKLGVIDYHGAQRTYNREQLGGINLNIDQSEQIGRTHSLYNWANKYSNIKSELATGYVRYLLSKEAGGNKSEIATLIPSLKELFATFFPGKRFKGPYPGPDGTLDFPVEVSQEAEHDIDDLSSGEKEVLFGYLRLRNNAPKNSIILIDEPELHLNPALLHGLPQFYHKYIGKDLGNQLWLVTHSDALLRESVGQFGFSVLHMQQASSTGFGENQLKEIEIDKPLSQAIIDLVGDLATYQPGKKVIIFEGGGDVDFDVRFASTLFPRIRSEVTVISAGDKTKVRNLHDLLRRAQGKGLLPNKFFSIVDKDSSLTESGTDSFTWDRYHIENYLLEPKYIIRALGDLNIKNPKLETEEHVNAQLVECAKYTLDSLVRHDLEHMANRTIVSAVKTSTKRESGQIAQALFDAVHATKVRIDDAIRDLSLDFLSKEEKRLTAKYEQQLRTSDWLESFRGRDILRRFVDQFVDRGVSYEVFRDMIIARMRDDGHRPIGMAKVFDAILKAAE